MSCHHRADSRLLSDSGPAHQLLRLHQRNASAGSNVTQVNVLFLTVKSLGTERPNFKDYFSYQVRPHLEEFLKAVTNIFLSLFGQKFNQNLY
jgi:hypothetical protein